MKNPLLTIMLSLVAAGVSAHGQSIYSTDFESPSFTNGNIHGQNGWKQVIKGDDGAFLIESGVSQHGTQALNIVGSTNRNRLKYTFPAAITPQSLKEYGVNNFWITAHIAAPNTAENNASKFYFQLHTGIGVVNYVFETDGTITHGVGGQYSASSASATPPPFDLLSLHIFEDSTNGGNTYALYANVFINSNQLTFPAHPGATNRGPTLIYNDNPQNLLLIAGTNVALGLPASSAEITGLGVEYTADTAGGPGGYLDNISVFVTPEHK